MALKHEELISDLQAIGVDLKNARINLERNLLIRADRSLQGVYDKVCAMARRIDKDRQINAQNNKDN